MSAANFSHVYLTNNTTQQLNVDVMLETSEPILVRGQDWDGIRQTIAPFETKEVLWFSRNKNLQPLHLYRYTIKTSYNDIEAPLYTRFNVKGNIVFGSSMRGELSLPNQLPQTIGATDGLEKKITHLWNDLVKSIYIRNQLPLGEVYNSYHLVLNEEENNNFETKTKNEISVLTYNTQLMPFYAGVVDDLNQPNVRVKLIPAAISNYDVVVLEELFDHDLRNKTIELMSTYYPYHTQVLGTGTTNILTGGVMLFSKWPIVNKQQYIYRARTGVDQFAQKGALYASINKEGRVYHVIGTHLQSDKSAEDVRVRTKQLQELMQFVATLNIPMNDPLIYTGDFNINEFSNEANTLYSMLNVKPIKNIGLTYSFDAELDTMANGQNRVRLDYVFNSSSHARAITALNKIFILRALDQEKMWPKFDLSDHFPVASYFKFAE